MRIKMIKKKPKSKKKNIKKLLKEKRIKTKKR